MEDLIIQATKKTPGVDLSNGVMVFNGCSIIKDTASFYDPIFAWVRKYMESPSDPTVFTVKLEYIDAASVQAMLEILQILKDLEKQHIVFMVNWYYEYGDLEMLQLGVILQDRLEMEFDFNEFEPGNSV